MASKFNRDKWIMSQLRRLSIKYPPRLKILNEGRFEYTIKSKKGTDMKRVDYNCTLCGKKGLKSKQIHMDHIKPVVNPEESNMNIWEWADKLFCDESNWQRICSECHDFKTAKENIIRVETRRKK